MSNVFCYLLLALSVAFLWRVAQAFRDWRRLVRLAWTEEPNNFGFRPDEPFPPKVRRT